MEKIMEQIIILLLIFLAIVYTEANATIAKETYLKSVKDVNENESFERYLEAKKQFQKTQQNIEVNKCN